MGAYDTHDVQSGFWPAWLCLVLHLLGCAKQPSEQGGVQQLNVYYDTTEDLVKRQLEFRKMRKTARDASSTSLSSLGVVSETDEEIMDVYEARYNMRHVHSMPDMSHRMLSGSR